MSASEPLQPSQSPREPNADAVSERDNKRIGQFAACLESLAHVRKASADKAISILASGWFGQVRHSLSGSG